MLIIQLSCWKSVWAFEKQFLKKTYHSVTVLETDTILDFELRIFLEKDLRLSSLHGIFSEFITIDL